MKEYNFTTEKSELLCDLLDCMGYKFEDAEEGKIKIFYTDAVAPYHIGKTWGYVGKALDFAIQNGYRLDKAK